MTNGETFIDSIVEILGRRHEITDLDIQSGTFRLGDGTRAINVTLPLSLLEEYAIQLNEDSIPDLRNSSMDAQHRLRAKYITIWIEELFESDLNLSLLEIRLSRTPEGRVSLADRRGPARRVLPLSYAEGNYWSPNRADT